MSKGTKKGKSDLARIYGKASIFERDHIAECIEAMGRYKNI